MIIKTCRAAAAALLIAFALSFSFGAGFEVASAGVECPCVLDCPPTCSGLGVYNQYQECVEDPFIACAHCRCW